MELVIIAVIVVAVVAFIAYPLLNTTKEKGAAPPDALDSLIAQRDSAYDALRDLDFDFQMGKLSQTDYEQLRAKYKTRAAQTLQQIDALGGAPGQLPGVPAESGAGDDIEAQVERLRQKKQSAPDDIEAEIARLRKSRQETPGGGRAASAGEAVEDEVARWRASRRANGGQAPAAQARCSTCGTPYHAGDRYCKKCGANLESLSRK